MAFELAWVDAGAATGSLAGCLALSPIHERGTPEQRAYYMSRCAPAQPGEDRKPWRGAFCLTEPIPYVGVETGMLGGKVRVAEWKEGEEPMLQVDKRGRFITNMGFANFVTAAVESDDPRIKGTCMVVLEETDPGLFDRGTPTRKLVHQLSSTRDPIFSLTIPASRIVGGYSRQGRRHRAALQPRRNHRGRFPPHPRDGGHHDLGQTALGGRAGDPLRTAGGSAAAPSPAPGSPRYELGLQLKQDVVHRLVDIWATGEASASLGFEAARAVRPARSPGKAEERNPGGARNHRRHGHVQGHAPGPEGRHRVSGRQAARSCRTTPWCSARWLDSRGQRAVPGLQALEYRPRRAA